LLDEDSTDGYSGSTLLVYSANGSRSGVSVSTGNLPNYVAAEKKSSISQSIVASKKLPIDVVFNSSRERSVKNKKSSLSRNAFSMKKAD
ncbi:MAG: hypothetical protein ACRCUT_13620, partial [Spirochaetota bacterium]